MRAGLLGSGTQGEARFASDSGAWYECVASWQVIGAVTLSLDNREFVVADFAAMRLTDVHSSVHAFHDDQCQGNRQKGRKR